MAPEAKEERGREAVGFLESLFGDPLPGKTKVALWTKADKRTHYLSAVGAASEFGGRADTYLHAALVTAGRVSGKRPMAKDAVGIAGVWADIDVVGGPDAPEGKRAAPNLDAAIELSGLILEPTLLVNSGYGLQAWWLYEEPWVFAEEPERWHSQRIVQGWQVLLRQGALDRGWTIDSTHDLARLMRLPGTVNDKGPPKTRRPVELIESDGPRYQLEEIASHALAAAPREPTGSGRIDLAKERAVPFGKFEALKENHPTFGKTWERARLDRAAKNWSASEYDLALVSTVLHAGWSDDETAALLTEFRLKHDPGDAKAHREDYLKRTIAKARSDMRRSEREEVQEQAIDELAEMSENSNGTIDPERAYALFNEAISGGLETAPKVKELVQYGEDPDDARYVLVLADGQEVNVGSYTNLRQPRRLDERFGPSTGFVLPKIKEDNKWIAALRTLLRVRQVKEEGEDKAREWVRRYVDDRLSVSRDEAAREDEPFEETREGTAMVFVRVNSLARYTRSVLRERVTPADLHPLLRRAGFSQEIVHYNTKSGRRTTASYWSITKEELE